MADHAAASDATPASEWDYCTIGELVAALRTRKISASELIDHAIARIEAADTRVNAVVVRDFDRAREAARGADAALARGERRPLLGVPTTVKEAFNVAGLPTTWGVPQCKDYIPEQDALVVSRLKKAGAVLLGKTNVPLLLGDFQSYNDIYGATNNPWDLGRSPGGSSGGSGAAVAAGFGPLSFGSDIGGSLRVPAHFCGVYAHKPTLGLVGMRGYNQPPSPPRPEPRPILNWCWGSSPTPTRRTRELVIGWRCRHRATTSWRNFAWWSSTPIRSYRQTMPSARR